VNLATAAANALTNARWIHERHQQPEQQGKGYGALVLQNIIKQAQLENYHLLIGGIDAANDTSIALHKKHGFTHSGTITQAGFKFGRWLDLAFYQLTLTTPLQPKDD